MGFFAPRISMRLIDEIDRLAQGHDRPADICRAIGKRAEEQGFRRPSYEQVRLYVRQAQRRRQRVSTAKVLLTWRSDSSTRTRSSDTSPAPRRASSASNSLLLEGFGLG
jgi:hypothetical protein